jgi:glycosyltransferase involved in cell wall biosynthesis
MSGKQVLVCGPMPQSDRDTGSRRTTDLIAFLQEASWTVTFVSHQEKTGPRYTRDLQQRGVAVYPGGSRWMERLLEVGKFDLALLVFWNIAESYLPLIRRISPGTRIVVDSVDVHFLRNARRTFQDSAEQERSGLLDSNYASQMIREMNTYVSADAVLAVSQKERELINDLSGARSLAHEVPISEDLGPSPLARAERAGILYLGGFRHPPNISAVEYLCKDILPQLDRHLLAQHPVSIVGDAAHEKLRGHVQGLPHVHVVGWVPSVVPYLQRSRIMVIPLRYGAGVKGKLVQTLMAGTPCVTTSIGAEGLDLCTEEHVLIADDPAGFAEAMARLLEDEELWERLARQGRAHITAISGREAVRRRFLQVIDAVLARAAKPPVQLAPTRQPSVERFPHGAYARLIRRIRRVVTAAVPAGARVLVVSKGDEELLCLDGRAAWHFPRAENGVYAGYYPSDSAAAIAHLEDLRAQGGDFFLLPRTAFWWLDHYREFKDHLQRRYPEVGGRPHVCLLYHLRAEAGASLTAAAVIQGNGAKRALTSPARRAAAGLARKSTHHAG